ncbi:amidohydrolase family protein [Aspergillus nomiae NRRL 13137]|uniref:Amidohydrolase family protein n=1 Tax=Aspergillus nomiae NRRL (strain ATCC 15546 / NRRL 13137 / CBS 260.88 / M93) TaxID=1509407 RepID=A0A0L1J2R7_ASPN3|nr:amidohydrolase family protein [Aspergillus nomiae NRRL 13137]KNG86101.1 amidohydrolase family protein [Aspergillus nomiae NRRL 13137]
MPIPIVDSHIHLFPESHLPTLAWYGPESPLGSQHSVDEYRLATSSISTTADTADLTYLRGFIFLETDRISSVEEAGKGWSHALDEVSLLTRIITGAPAAGEGHHDKDRHLCLGFLPWAPVPGGSTVLQKYMDLVKERTKTDDVWKKLRGVRYLFQDKPKGVMLQDDVVEGLKWLGREKLVFDLGVDARQGGFWQLREAVEMMRRVYDGVKESEKVVIVINHLCKPNLRLPDPSPASITTHPEFLEWSSLVTAMAQYPNTYMKLSGGFSELLPVPSDPEPDIASIVERIRPWTDVVFDTFGAERVMFGSDWPVCNVGGGGNAVTWRRWKSIVESILEKRQLTDEEKRNVWGGVAVKAYGVEI